MSLSNKCNNVINFYWLWRLSAFVRLLIDQPIDKKRNFLRVQRNNAWDESIGGAILQFSAC